MEPLLKILPARLAIQRGSVEMYTDQCFKVIESLHDLFVRRLTSAEKEVEKRWIDEHLGFQGKWREGWLMYDGTIVVLYKKPGLNGDAYYTRKGNYGLNAQVRMVRLLSHFTATYLIHRLEMSHQIFELWTICMV